MGESDDAKHGATSRKVGKIRNRALELLADASLHAERVGAAAARLGLTPTASVTTCTRPRSPSSTSRRRSSSARR